MRLISKFWKFKLDHDEWFQTSIKGKPFENNWIKLDQDGGLSIKRQYAWDGCSPKRVILGTWVIGTPDGVVDIKTEKPAFFFASLVHDALMQFRKEIGISVETANLEFWFEATHGRSRPVLAELYYSALRMYWKLKKD